MNVRFHTNPDGEPHIHDQGISEVEVYEAPAGSPAANPSPPPASRRRTATRRR